MEALVSRNIVVAPLVVSILHMLLQSLMSPRPTVFGRSLDAMHEENRRSSSIRRRCSVAFCRQPRKGDLVRADELIWLRFTLHPSLSDRLGACKRLRVPAVR